MINSTSQTPRNPNYSEIIGVNELTEWKNLIMMGRLPKQKVFKKSNGLKNI